MMGIGMGMNMGNQMNGTSIIPPAQKVEEKKEAPAEKCPRCGAIIAPNAKFCAECGTKILRNCPECGTAVTLNQKFCPECGKALYKKEN